MHNAERVGFDFNKFCTQDSNACIIRKDIAFHMALKLSSSIKIKCKR